MGVVYEAVHQATGERVAVKVVASGSPRLLPAIREEIAFLEEQKHPGIVRIIEHGIVDGEPWYAMELLEGRTLEKLNLRLWSQYGGAVPSSRPKPDSTGHHGELIPAAGGRLNEVLTLYSRLCVPLGFVHRAGFVHCDLKPANVFIRGDGQPVLMDFGLLSRAGGAIGRERLEVGGHLRGTLPYMSPELIWGQIPDARADLYSLGCMLYESVTGRPPFLAKTANGFLQGHLNAVPEIPSRLVANVPQGLDELIISLLAKHPAERIGDADVVAERCSQMVRSGYTSQGPSSPRASSVPPTPYLFRPRLVGRDDAMRRIQAEQVQAQQGQGRILLIDGESGIGKTFLASEIAQRALRAGFEVITGECMPVAAAEQAEKEEIVGAPLAPFRKLLLNAADRCRDSGSAAAISLFGSDRTIALLARYEPALLHLLELRPDESIPPLPPIAERERVLRALADLLKALSAENPILLIIDDVQWADDLSLAFLEFLSGSDLTGQHLLVLALYRSEEVSKPILDLTQKSGVQSLRLGRLGTSALTVLVGDLLSDHPPAAFVHALAAHSEGNPFFVAEYLRAGAAEGLLERTPAGWKLAESGVSLGYEGLALPRSLQALLERRLAALTPMARRATEAGAVLGREFPVGMLQAVMGLKGDEIQGPIGEMLERQIVHRVSPLGLRFFHDKTREAAYAHLEPGRRAMLHGAAANAIEGAYSSGAELPAHYAMLAYHLRHAGEIVRAVDYFEKAGRHALRSSANADAVRLFNEASQLVATANLSISPLRRASWQRMAGDALHGLGHLEESKRHLLEAVALLRWPMPTKPSQIGMAILPKLGRQIFHRAAPRRWIESDPERSEVLLEGARAYNRLEQIYYYRGEYLPLFLANLTTLNLSERAIRSSHLAAAYTNAAATAGIVPLHKTAVRYFELAEETLGAAYDAEVESYLRLLHAVYLTGLGQWERAAEKADRALELADRLGFRRRWEEAAGVRGGAECDFDKRLEWARRTHQSALQRDDPQMTSWGLLAQAEVLAARGDFALASEAVGKVEAIISRLGAPEQMWAFGMRSFLLLTSGELNEAAAIADRASALIKQTKPIHVGGIESYTRIAQVQLAAWKAAPPHLESERRAKARAACADLATASRIFPIAIPSYCLHEGTMRWMCGKTGAALAMWKRGLLVAKELRLPYREVQLLLTLGNHSPRTSPDAQDAVAEGRQIAERLRLGDDAFLITNAAAH
jgi:serine/threonine protein kinase/tetratricopeptide (TPR) repeat protein